MTGLFEQLVKGLGDILRLPLHADRVGACSILIPPEIIIQLQLDESQENFFFFCKIIALPPGRFREDVLASALKANALPDPLAGILAYHSTSDHLVLFQKYPVFILNPERLAGLFGGFLNMANKWKQAIQNGQSTPSEVLPKHPGPFGLR